MQTVPSALSQNVISLNHASNANKAYIVPALKLLSKLLYRCLTIFLHGINITNGNRCDILGRKGIVTFYAPWGALCINFWVTPVRPMSAPFFFSGAKGF